MMNLSTSPGSWRIRSPTPGACRASRAARASCAVRVPCRSATACTERASESEPGGSPRQSREPKRALTAVATSTSAVTIAAAGSASGKAQCDEDDEREPDEDAGQHAGIDAGEQQTRRPVAEHAQTRQRRHSENRELEAPCHPNAEANPPLGRPPGLGVSVLGPAGGV